MPEQLHLIVNPLSRNGSSKRRAQVERLLRTQGYQLTPYLTTSAGDAERYVAGLQPGALVAVLGGDGTITEAARGAARSEAVLIPLPGGRGNDLCRYFGIPLDIEAAVQALPTFAERRIDAATINGRLFVGVATIGFDSIANDNANRSRLRGSAVYLAGALRALVRFKPLTFSLVVDGEARQLRGWSVIIANSGRYGGGMRISPSSRIDDGLLELVTIGEASRLHWLRSMPGVFAGTHIRNPMVGVEQVTRVRIEAIRGGTRSHRRRMAIFADGDRGPQVPIEIEAIAGAIRMLVPAD